MWLVWLSMFVLSLILEASTEALVSIWFAAGALVSLGCSFIPGLPYWGEIIVFFAVPKKKANPDECGCVNWF